MKWLMIQIKPGQKGFSYPLFSLKTKKQALYIYDHMKLGSIWHFKALYNGIILYLIYLL